MKQTYKTDFVIFTECTVKKKYFHVQLSLIDISQEILNSRSNLREDLFNNGIIDRMLKKILYSDKEKF